VSLAIIDFHCHHVPERFPLTTVETAPPTQKARWAATNKLISDEKLLLADIEAGDLSARVVNCPTAHLCDTAGNVPAGTIEAINDELAVLQSRHPGRIHALATVDAYDGDRAARELERAITKLGLKGVFVECAKGSLLIDAPQAAPTLEVAAKLGIPVFVHPVNPQPLLGQMEPYGRIGTLFARGTVNSQSLIALIEGGTFTRLPDLRVVVTALAFGGLAMASGFSHFSKLPAGTRDILRRNIFIDTMEFDANMIRAAVGMVGPSNVLAGSDWPIVNDGAIRGKLEAALAAAGLSPEDRARVAGGNALGLLAGAG
jgi:aminocarboxymuconate-semialdehyde decarboxylase